MAGMIPMAIAFIVAYWFYITAKRAELKDNEPLIWCLLGGVSFYAIAKIIMYVVTQLFVISLIEGTEPSMPRFLIVGVGCVFALLFSIYIHAKFLPISKKNS
ncbi:MAG: hypothetical protein K0U68_07380 [Gammaproteobacteria bacterium]|nr:hypothetical protein [Gammaproteobacteria bacterium]